MKISVLIVAFFSSACIAQALDFSSLAGTYRGSTVGDTDAVCEASIVLEPDGTVKFHLSSGDQEISLIDNPQKIRRTWRIEDIGIASFLIIDQAGQNLALETIVLGIWDEDVLQANPPYYRGELHALSLRTGGASDLRLDCSLLRKNPAGS